MNQINTAVDLLEVDELTSTFPVEVFPESIREIILEAEKGLRYPIDFTAASMLFAASVAIGNSHAVAVMDGWREKPIMYITLVGRAGTNKSHPLSFAIEPILRKDRDEFEAYQDRLKDYTRSISEAKQNKVLSDETEPQLKKYIVSDYTPEALSGVHNANPRGLGVYADELAGWFKNFNRYHRGGDQEFWLSGWSGKPVIIDRVKKTINIPDPFISVIGTIQKALLEELGKESRTLNGFTDRILFAMPDDVRKQYWGADGLAEQFRSRWERFITRMMDLPKDPMDEDGIGYSSEAWDTLTGWQRGNTDRCNEAESEAIASIYAKLEVYVIRLSLILQMLRWATGEAHRDQIDAVSVMGAIQLIEYFRMTALKVWVILSQDDPLEKLPKDKQALYEALPERFKTGLGIEVARSMNFPERTFKRMLMNKDLFDCISWGEYGKKL